VAAPHPNPLPARAGRGRRPSLLSTQPNFIPTLIHIGIEKSDAEQSGIIVAQVVERLQQRLWHFAAQAQGISRLENVIPHRQQILLRLRVGAMPCDGARPDQYVTVSERWASDQT
jgi:hypothetical protein